MAIVYHQCLSEARREGVGHGASSSKPGIISIINRDNPCLSKDVRAGGPGKLLGVLPPSWCLGMSQDRPASSFPALNTFLRAHLRQHYFSLGDELVWGFNSRNSRSDAQNKPARLKIAHTGCCFFQERDVTRWALLGLYIKPHHDVAWRHPAAPSWALQVCRDVCASAQPRVLGDTGGSWGCAGSPGKALFPRGRSHYALLPGPLWRLNPKHYAEAQALPAVVLHQEVQM